MLRASGLPRVRVEAVGPNGYDPGARTVRLAGRVARGRSLTARALAAHEVAHAAQHGARSPRWRLSRLLIVPGEVGGLVSPALGFGLALGDGALIRAGLLGLAAWIGRRLARVALEREASRWAVRLAVESGVVAPDDAPAMARCLARRGRTYEGRVLPRAGPPGPRRPGP
jgi:Zn-dependent membrane protease YugP